MYLAYPVEPPRYRDIEISATGGGCANACCAQSDIKMCTVLYSTERTCSIQDINIELIHFVTREYLRSIYPEIDRVGSRMHACLALFQIHSSAHDGGMWDSVDIIYIRRAMAAMRVSTVLYRYPPCGCGRANDLWNMSRSLEGRNTFRG